MKLVICDLDDTLNTISRVRAHLVPADTTCNADWEDWHSAHVKEQAKEGNVALLNQHLLLDFECVIWTARSETCLRSTVRQVRPWLIRSPLYYEMRHLWDKRQPVEMKLRKLEDIVRRHLPEHLVIIDDDPELCRLIRSHAELNHYGRPVEVIQVERTGLHA